MQGATPGGITQGLVLVILSFAGFDSATALGDEAKNPLMKPIDVLFAILAVSFMILPFIGIIGIPGSSLFPVPDFPQNILPYLVLMYFMAGFGWFLVQKKRYSKIVENMNNSIEEIHTRFSDEENL
ncbi:MAG: hypothetical protein EAZ78_15825 [Oscillatoriales cyanobacterium]|nr:MAG: hypothetical protein EA000_06250 [Oscillatoriales cyanobacterium]TAD99869.1 MAG: hypothetical protein EAZ96_22230 [Oscillatoriales cyanobacterium]TAF02096.1 MAG: hypothetical protein EAZ78_15825 [Oscillatoriales cyanobacterium]TAF32413.1 MAG: hypothetical protein EAZ68_20930 [Oscillatoriales cyanobacterium]TAF70056.1 MAG: hypothetical protein EAZ59_06155 [Oscillatoriales cyanobacterium]